MARCPKVQVPVLFGASGLWVMSMEYGAPHTDTARLFGEKCRTCVRNTVSSRLFWDCGVVWLSGGWVAFFGLSTLSTTQICVEAR